MAVDSRGALYYMWIVALVFAGLAILGTFALRPLSESRDILASMARLPAVGPGQVMQFSVPGTPAGEGDEVVVPPVHEQPIAFRGSELVALTVTSTENISLAQDPDAEMDTMQSTNVKADEPIEWRKRPELGQSVWRG